MIKSRVLLAGALLAAAGSASAAGISVTPTVATDYDFRGISQTAMDPTFQLGVNYAHDSGFYAGVWGSNVDFLSNSLSGPDPDVEIDGFVGFAGGDAAETFGYDLGFIYYTYVSESDLNYNEIYAGVSKGPFAAKLWYSWNFGGDFADDAGLDGGAYYLEANGTFPIGESGFSALAHVGWSGGSYWEDALAAAGDDGYFDWSVGVSKSFGPVAVTAKYIDGSDIESPPGAQFFQTGAKFWLSASTTLPWAE